MRAVFDHSWKLLSEQERSALMGLALFRGGCTREAAEKVAGATLPLLASLIDKSLLRRNAVGAAARFDLHELIRHYAADHLQGQGEIRTLQGRHAQFFAGLIEQIETRLVVNEALDWRRMIAVEQENLRAALNFTLTEHGDVELGLRLAANMGRYWCESDVWKEGRDWLCTAQQHNQPPDTRQFFKLIAKVIDVPWTLVVGADTVKAKRTLFDRYFERLKKVAQHDTVVALAFIKVVQLLAPPTKLLPPRVIMRVLLGGWPGGQQQPSVKPSVSSPAHMTS